MCRYILWNAISRLEEYFVVGPLQGGGEAKVRPTYIFDGNIWMHR